MINLQEHSHYREITRVEAMLELFDENFGAIYVEGSVSEEEIRQFKDGVYGLYQYVGEDVAVVNFEDDGWNIIIMYFPEDKPSESEIKEVLLREKKIINALGD